MFYSRGSRKVRIFKGGSYIDYSAWEFILNDTIDVDGDGIFDYEDSDLTDGPAYQDSDGDGIVDQLDDDDDNDGVLDAQDSDHPSNTGKPDTDGDGIIDEGDDDDDNDGIPDAQDSDHPSNTGKPDTDGDGIIDEGDDDDDNDGIPDAQDSDHPSNTGKPDTDGDGIIDEGDDDDDNDGVLDVNDDFPLDDTENTDADGDGVGSNTDDDDNDGTVTGDIDLDGIDDAVDDDRDNDGYADEVDLDPSNPYVFTGDEDGDGVDSTIDPDDGNPAISIFTPTSQGDQPLAFFNYDYGSNYGTYADYYRHNVALSLPPEAQGCLIARAMVTSTSSSYVAATDIQYMSRRTTAFPSTYTSIGGSNGSRNDFDPYPTTTGISCETFFRVSVPKGVNGWSSSYNFEFNIIPVPYFSNDGVIFSMPFEWAGYYPLYSSQAEAAARSSQNSAHSHTFAWNAGTQNDAAPSVSSYPIWDRKTMPVTKVFWMPDGLSTADTNTPQRQYLTHSWHGNHPGLPVWSVSTNAGANEGLNGGFSDYNGMTFEWMGPQGGAGQNLTLNHSSYNGTNFADMIFPTAIKSLTLKAIKEAISVTVS